MWLDGILAELMVKVSPKLYCKFITTNAKGKLGLYVQLKKAVYGMMKSALLFHRKLVADLTSLLQALQGGGWALSDPQHKRLS